MQQWRVEARCLAFLVALLFFSTTVLASEQPYFPKEAKWRNTRITLSLSRSLESSSSIQADVAQVLGRSLSAWSNPTTISFKVIDSDLESVSQKGNKGDGISLITSAMTPENLRMFPLQDASPAAVTRVFRDVLGNITEADIVLNPFVRFSTDGSFDTYDLQDTLTHEVGHLLGLDHSPVWSSIMHHRGAKSPGPVFFKGSRDELAQVDASSIKGLYGPRPEDVLCCSVVQGRVSGILADMRVLLWIEESETGRLIAAAVPEKNGSYRIDGVPEGKFVLFASGISRSNEFATESSKLVVEMGDTARENFHLRPIKSDVTIQLLGTSVQLAALPVSLRSISQGLFLGVEGSPNSIGRLGISGVDAAFEPHANNLPTFASVKVVAFGSPIQLDLPKGEYTLVITANSGVKQYLVGSVVNR